MIEKISFIRPKLYPEFFSLSVFGAVHVITELKQKQANEIIAEKAARG